MQSNQAESSFLITIDQYYVKKITETAKLVWAGSVTLKSHIFRGSGEHLDIG